MGPEEEEPELLTVNSHLVPNGVHVEAVGDIDLYSVGLLENAVMSGITQISEAPADQTLTLDLRRVDFIDSAGLALLLKARKGLAASDRPFLIRLETGTQPERVLKLGRFDTVLHFLYDNE